MSVFNFRTTSTLYIFQTVFSITALAEIGCLHQPFGGLTLSSFSFSGSIIFAI